MVLNSVLYRANTTQTYVIGLGTSQFVDGRVTAITAESHAATAFHALALHGLGTLRKLGAASIPARAAGPPERVVTR